MNTPPDPIDIDELLKFGAEQTKSAADAMSAPGAQAILALIPGFEGACTVARNKLAAMRFQIGEMESSGADAEHIDRVRVLTESSANEYRMFGGDPSVVEADHVTAWVHDSSESGITYGWCEVPVSAARKVDGRWEAQSEDLPDGYA